MSPTRSRYFIPRIIFYIVLQGLVLGAYTRVVEFAGLGKLGDIDLRGLLREDKILEFLELGILALTALLGLGAAKRGQPSLHRIFALLVIFAMCRESDDIWEHFFFEDAHHIPMGIINLCVLYVAVKNRRELAVTIPGFFSRPGSLLMLFGLLLVIVYAQMLGQRDIWKILAPSTTTEAKRFVEEGLEFMGYFNILLGLLEERFFSGPRNRRAAIEAETG